jgi:hypothetical protein
MPNPRLKLIRRPDQNAVYETKLRGKGSFRIRGVVGLDFRACSGGFAICFVFNL